MQFDILNYRSMRQESWVVGWIQLTLLSYVIVSFVININWDNWLDNKQLLLVYHQVN